VGAWSDRRRRKMCSSLNFDQIDREVRRVKNKRAA
jgi:hypothetical protein